MRPVIRQLDRVSYRLKWLLLRKSKAERKLERRKIRDLAARNKIAAVIRESGQFDAMFYLREYPDVALSYIDPIMHYVSAGSEEGRKPRADFDPAFYRKAYKDVLRSREEPFFHYLTIGRFEGRATSRMQITGKHYSLVDDSGLFNEAFYRASIPHLGADVDAIEHYLNVGYLYHLDPGPEFDATFYVSQNPDARNNFMAPLLHYILNNHETESTKPSSYFDWLVGANSAELRPCSQGPVHIERHIAEAFNYRYAFSETGPYSLLYCREATSSILNHDYATVNLQSEPIASIIIPVYGQVQYVLGCLEALSRHRSKYIFEVIVIDDASPPETGTECLSDIKWIRLIREETNRGFLKACNYAAEFARGKYIVLLNSDTRVCSGWLDELLDTFSVHRKAGVVGSKLYHSDGSLQEAGCIVWNDGSAWNYGRDRDPSEPEYCFARQTDYCSAAAVAVRRDVWESLKGFDEYFCPAYFEDVDFAFRARSGGYEVWFQPLAQVIHYEGKTHGKDAGKGIKAYERVNKSKFFERWHNTLTNHRKNGQLPVLEANRARERYMLALDALTPTPDQDAGSVMTIKLLEIYQRQGWQITFMPVHNRFYMGRYSKDLQRLGIETFYDPAAPNLDQIQNMRPQYYDVILGFRITVFGHIFDRLRRMYPEALMLFHNIDLHYLRMQRESELTGNLDLRRLAKITKRKELDLISKVDCTIVPSVVEKEILGELLPDASVVVYPYTADIVESSVTFSDRKHLVFVGGFRHQPNVDAVTFFVDQVWPKLLVTLGSNVKFYVVGADAPDSIMQLQSDCVIVTGYIDKLETILENCRIFVAPLRFGAGLKGKLVTSLSHGVPCVATTIAVEGMSLIDERDVLIANDPVQFAEQIIRLYNNEALWKSLQQSGYNFVSENYSWEAGRKIAEEALRVAANAKLTRRHRV